MFLVGLPTFYLELAIGQYAGETPHLLYRKMLPLFTGNVSQLNRKMFRGVETLRENVFVVYIQVEISR
jgi:SNF family Na+-dependent transporter